VGLSPVGGVGCRFGPSRSRCRSPAIVAETAAQWNKSFWICPRLVGASLRCRRRVHGGGSPLTEPLCRSPWPAASLLGVRRDEVGVGLLFPGWRGSSGLRGDVEVGSSSYFPWRWLSSTASTDSRPSLLGAWPRPMCVLRLCSFVWMSFYCGSVQSLRAMERSRIWGRRCLCVLASGDRQLRLG